VSIADEQAGHTAHIAGLIYARGIMEQAGAVADKRQQFRASSSDCHRFLRLGRSGAAARALCGCSDTLLQFYDS
jgi:hypothetical protein